MAAAAAPAVARAPFELKTVDLPMASLLLHTADLAALRDALHAKLADTPHLFNHDPVVIDLQPLAAPAAVVDFAELVALLRGHRMQPVAVSGASAEQLEAALAQGLSEAPVLQAARMPAAPAAPVEVVREIVREVVREVPAAPVPTLVVDKPLRSGQQVYARGGDLVLLAAVNFGAEVIADGHIHVYAPLRGKAIAGNRGNEQARIFTTCLEPELIAIAGVYRTTETALPAEVAGKPAQVRLQGDKLVMEPL